MNILVRFRENRSISRGGTQSLFQINVNSRLFFKLTFEFMIMGTHIKDLVFPITTVPIFFKIGPKFTEIRHFKIIDFIEVYRLKKSLLYHIKSIWANDKMVPHIHINIPVFFFWNPLRFRGATAPQSLQ